MKKGKKEGSGPLSPLEVTSARRDGACNNGARYNNNGCPPPCLHLQDQKLQVTFRAQTFGGHEPFFPPWFPQGAFKLLLESMQG